MRMVEGCCELETERGNELVRQFVPFLGVEQGSEIDTVDQLERHVRSSFVVTSKSMTLTMLLWRSLRGEPGLALEQLDELLDCRERMATRASEHTRCENPLGPLRTAS